MKSRTKKIIGICCVVLVSYFAAYFLSVTPRLLTPLGPTLAGPAYRPFDKSIVRVFFAPAYFLDASYLRPAYWDRGLYR